MGFLTYLMNRMRNENDYALGFTLNVVITKMFGWKDYVINELKASELNLLASGLVLLLEGKNQSQFRKNGKSCDALVQFFWDNPNSKGLAVQLMV